MRELIDLLKSFHKKWTGAGAVLTPPTIPGQSHMGGRVVIFGSSKPKV